MRTSLLIILGSIIGTIIVFVFIGLYIYGKVKAQFSPEELTEFGKAVKGEVMSNKDAYGTKKTILGLTNVLEGQIKKDFADFNTNHLFSEIEDSISSYLSAITNQSLSNIDRDRMVLMIDEIGSEIDSLKGSQTYKTYKDVAFSKHVIKSYNKSNGTATIVTQSQVGFIYDSNIPGDKKYKDVRKETIFTCKFIYITDASKYDTNAITTRCPNCAAPHTSLDGGDCSYCGTYIKPVDIFKIWKISDIKEEHY